MPRAVFAILLLLAGFGPSNAQPFRPNLLIDITMCADSDAWRHALELLRKGDASAANRFMTFAVGSGRCAQVPAVTYQPEAIVEEWAEDDGSGTPGLIVAGHILGKEGGKEQRAFIWVTPDLLRVHFGLNAPRT